MKSVPSAEDMQEYSKWKGILSRSIVRVDMDCQLGGIQRHHRNTILVTSAKDYLYWVNWGQNVGGSNPWAGVPDWMKGRKWAEIQHSLLQASWLWRPCDQLLQATAAFPAMMDCVPSNWKPKHTLPALGCSCWGVLHNSKASNEYKH